MNDNHGCVFGADGIEEMHKGPAVWAGASVILHIVAVTLENRGGLVKVMVLGIKPFQTKSGTIDEKWKTVKREHGADWVDLGAKYLCLVFSKRCSG